VVLDAPTEVRRRIDPWARGGKETVTELDRRVKAAFDRTNLCNPGLLFE